VVITTLRLDGLDNDSGRRVMEGRNDVLNLLQATLLLAGVLLGVLLERVLELREGCLWPVEGGDVQLVDGLGAGAGERAEKAAVEATTER